MMLATPSPARLLRWLDDNPEKLERYLGKHPEAEPELDRLVQLPAPACSALANALAAPADLTDRLRSRLAVRSSPTDTQAVVTDLLSLGRRTARLLFSDQSPSEEPTS